MLRLTASRSPFFALSFISLLGSFNAAFAARRLGTIQYDARFTNDRFGIFVPAEGAKTAPVEKVLRDAGAEEVRRG